MDPMELRLRVAGKLKARLNPLERRWLACEAQPASVQHCRRAQLPVALASGPSLSPCCTLALRADYAVDRCPLIVHTCCLFNLSSDEAVRKSNADSFGRPSH